MVDQRFPHFETHREKVGGGYWFPIYTYSDDVLVFRGGRRVHIRMTIRYNAYKRFRVKGCIVGVDCPKEKAIPTGADRPSIDFPSSELQKAEMLNAEVFRLTMEGKYREAIPDAERMLAVYERAVGPDHIYVTASLNTLAELYRAVGDYARTENLYQRILKIKERSLGLDHPELAQPLMRLIELFYSQGDYQKAEPILQHYLAVLEKAHTAGHDNSGGSLSIFGEWICVRRIS